MTQPVKVVTPPEVNGVTPTPEPGLSQSGEQGEAIAPISYPGQKPPVMVTFDQGMVRATVAGRQHNTFIGPDPKDDLWRVVMSCFEWQNHHAAINALTPTRNGGSIAPNSKIDELRPEQPASGVTVSGPWMPGDWDRR